MKLFGRIAVAGAWLALSACGNGTDRSVTEEVGEDQSTMAEGAGSVADAPAADPQPDPVVVDRTEVVVDRTDTDREGADLRVGPDGARLEIDDEDVDVKVRTDDPAVDVEAN